MTASQRDAAIVRVEIKDTRHGKLAARSEVNGPAGLRGPTDAERKASELHNKILDQIDESEYGSGEVVADSHVTDDGVPWIEWRNGAARTQSRSDG